MASSFISDLWNEWNIRGFVILSLSLQVFLILFAPFRKKTANRPIIFLLWLAYLIADWVAAFAIGLISHNQGNSSVHSAEVDGALRAFWASFLLLHLGGPDTITAFSLEDSSLWRRHLLNLVFQVGAAIYVFMQIFPSDKSLGIPTMLVFLAGVIKNAERTLALVLSSLPRLKLRVLSSPNFPVEVDHPWIKGEKMPKQELENEYSDEKVELPESIVVKHAYYFFQIFKIFLGDLMFTQEHRKISRAYFDKVSAVDALRVISVELHFIYEMLHTKALAIHSKWSYIFRFIAFISTVMSFILFNRLKKYWLSKLDVKITYTLLFGGIALDVIALFMLVFSDWSVVKFKSHKFYKTRSSKLNLFLHMLGSSKLGSFLPSLISAMDDWKKLRFATYKAKPNINVTYDVLDTPLIFRRWSESIFAWNLFSQILMESPRKMYKRNWRLGNIASSNLCNLPFRMAKKIISCLHQSGETIARDCGLRTTKEKIARIVNTKYVSKNPFIKKLWIFIFQEVKRKSKNVDEVTEVKRIYEARGDLFLKSRPGGIDCDYLLEDVTAPSYDDSIIMWHIATEIWYHKEKPTERNDEREFSKILSDYMLYLLFNQPNVVSAVAGIAQITLQDMLEQFQSSLMSRRPKDVEGLCRLLSEDAFMRPLPRSVYVFSQGMNLAQKMERLEEMKWKVMSGVWVEMLSYAAIHIKGETHVQVLSKGGELLAFLWLLMAHFGCVYKLEVGIFYDHYHC